MIETLITLALITGFASKITYAAAIVSRATTQRAQEATRQETHAVLLGKAHPAKCGGIDASPLAAPDGMTRTGKITAMSAPTAGNTVMMWTNGSGRLTGL